MSGNTTASSPRASVLAVLAMQLAWATSVDADDLHRWSPMRAVAHWESLDIDDRIAFEMHAERIAPFIGLGVGGAS